jgi:hypothetical protein
MTPSAHYYDVRIGLCVDCLPAQRTPWISRFGAHIVVSASLPASIAAVADYREWIASEEHARG